MSILTTAQSEIILCANDKPWRFESRDRWVHRKKKMFNLFSFWYLHKICWEVDTIDKVIKTLTVLCAIFVQQIYLVYICLLERISVLIEFTFAIFMLGDDGAKNSNWVVFRTEISKHFNVNICIVLILCKFSVKKINSRDGVKLEFTFSFVCQPPPIPLSFYLQMQ